MYTFKLSKNCSVLYIYKQHDSLHRALIHDPLGHKPEYHFDRDRIWDTESLATLMNEFGIWRLHNKSVTPEVT